VQEKVADTHRVNRYGFISFFLNFKGHPMRAIKEARKFIERNPSDPSAKTLAKLVLALESEVEFPIANIYQLDLDRFNLALEILREWRLDRYFAGKAKLFDTATQVSDLAD
jgi:hypothetical protein